MAQIKTKPNNVEVKEFIESFAATAQKKEDGFELLRLFEEYTGYKAKMWGPSMIGFGEYHYKSERSKQEGNWPLVAFSPRKAAISLYVYAGAPCQDDLLKRLGKFKMGKGCIYVNKLSDINQAILKEMIDGTITFLSHKYL